MHTGSSVECTPCSHNQLLVQKLAGRPLTLTTVGKQGTMHACCCKSAMIQVCTAIEEDMSYNAMDTMPGIDACMKM